MSQDINGIWTFLAAEGEWIHLKTNCQVVTTLVQQLLLYKKERRKPTFAGARVRVTRNKVHLRSQNSKMQMPLRFEISNHKGNVLIQKGQKLSLWLGEGVAQDTAGTFSLPFHSTDPRALCNKYRPTEPVSLE